MGAVGTAPVSERVWICTKCWTAQPDRLVVLASHCPSCEQATRWTLTPHEDLPRVAYVLTTNDRSLLKALRIGAE